MSHAVIVFAKEPIAGAVKTRLRGCFTDAGLLRLYKAFVRDTLAIAKRVPHAKMILAFSSSAAPRYLKGIARDFVLIKQIGGDLGTRMNNALVYAGKNKSKKTVIIGTDSPTLPADFIAKAFEELDAHDLVLGPCPDGGYYLIGAKEPCPGLFEGIRWSSSSTRDDTLRNARRLGKTAALLAEWYDVDDRRGLLRLLNHLEADKNQATAFYTRRALNKGAAGISGNKRPSCPGSLRGAMRRLWR